jgi:broad specificity phosphatase PhoE
MSSAALTTVEVYPLSHKDKLNGHDVKTVHIVRHAQGTHNVKKEYKDIRNMDARLTDFGKEQCAALSSKAPTLVSQDAVVVCSPLTRCIQTSLHSFPHLERFMAHECLRETVNYACDRRRVISEIQADHPEVDFSHIDNHEDEVWNYYDELLGKDYDGTRESAHLYKVAERGRSFFVEWLKARKEEEIVVCSHEAFLRCILNWGQEGGVPLMPEQHLDNRGDEQDVALFRYCGDDSTFEEYMRSGYNNCELRSFLIAFPPQP